MKTIIKFVLIMFVLEAMLTVAIMSTVRKSQIEWCEQRSGEMVGGTCYYNVYVQPEEAG